ncbi:ulp1 protease family, C-terminal catalytic domain-containing protein [Artemisia annua]|uniref:Ulp1 protease family, C-terminal catalytic domain-containing protein n=1 Tax=Artemisia annua TaxID=35608 RepID=A0A2U1LA51_ARTAN|nr:ulp1 protease family, C-terminal catalytic domain-containing protein [Artemisia annua]
MGFGDYCGEFNFESTPTALGMWLCKNFDANNSTLVLSENRKIKITKNSFMKFLRENEESKGGFGQLSILEGLQYIETPKKSPKKNLKKKKNKIQETEQDVENTIVELYTPQLDLSCGLYGTMNRDEELALFKTKSKKHPKLGELMLADARMVPIKWNTTYNVVDCGIFAMRHMEMYAGEGVFLNELQREGAALKSQLKMLHAKYLAKILLKDINLKKKKLIKEAEAFGKKQAKKSKILTHIDVKVDENLMKRFNDTLVKTLE